MKSWKARLLILLTMLAMLLTVASPAMADFDDFDDGVITSDGGFTVFGSGDDDDDDDDDDDFLDDCDIVGYNPVTDRLIVECDFDD